jgi:hypothetical protein
VPSQLEAAARLSLTEQSDGLVDRIAGFSLDIVPVAVAVRAKLIFLDVLGSALSVLSSSHPALGVLAELTRRTAGRPESTLIGQGRRASRRDAVGTQEPAKVRLSENEGVIQALAANGPDEPLHEGVLPRGSRGDTERRTE